MKRSLIFLSILFIWIAATAHPIKMTTARLAFDKRQSQLILTINFFEDDFKSHLEKIYHRRDLNFSSPTELEKTMVVGYVNKKIVVKVNKVLYALNIQSLKRTENNVIQGRFILAVPQGKPVRLIEVTNALLFEAFSEQVNVLHLDFPAEEGTIFQFMPSQPYKALNVSL